MSEADAYDQRAEILQGAGDKLVDLQATLERWAGRLDDAVVAMGGWTGDAGRGARTKYGELAAGCRSVANGLQSTIDAYFDAAKELRKAARTTRVMTWLNPLLIAIDIVVTIVSAVFTFGAGGFLVRLATTAAKCVVKGLTAAGRVASAGARALGTPGRAVAGAATRAWTGGRAAATSGRQALSRAAARASAGTRGGWTTAPSRIPLPVRDAATLGRRAAQQYSTDFLVNLTNQGVIKALTGEDMDYATAAQWAAVAGAGAAALPAARTSSRFRRSFDSDLPTPTGRANQDGGRVFAFEAASGTVAHFGLSPLIDTEQTEDTSWAFPVLLGYANAGVATGAASFRAGRVPGGHLRDGSAAQAAAGRAASGGGSDAGSSGSFVSADSGGGSDAGSSGSFVSADSGGGSEAGSSGSFVSADSGSGSEEGSPGSTTSSTAGDSSPRGSHRQRIADFLDGLPNAFASGPPPDMLAAQASEPAEDVAEVDTAPVYHPTPEQPDAPLSPEATAAVAAVGAWAAAFNAGRYRVRS